jgi:HKD family nuclease
MAKTRFILQGLRKDNDHLRALVSLLSPKKLDFAALSVAFVRESGVFHLDGLLNLHSSSLKVFVGIRNGVTSAQGLIALLKCRVSLFVVDTGSTSPIFHPKFYLASQEKKAIFIIGSANITHSGLSRNIEASTVSELDLTNSDDKHLYDDVISSLQVLEKMTPHVIRITSQKQILSLLKDARIEDERLAPIIISRGIRKDVVRDSLKRMKLFGADLKPPLVKRANRAVRSDGENTGRLELIWISNELKERDLNIPSGANTHATGSMLLKKGRNQGIDQRSFFRHDVFANLRWETEPHKRSGHIERAEFSCELIVKGINYGVFKLKLAHNPRTDTASYQQKNAMTSFSWGDAKSIIAKKDLLARELRLYRKINRDQFTMRIE